MYKFNRVQPALLTENPDILSIPPEALREDTGSATWSTSVEVRLSPEVLSWRRTDTTYTLMRSIRWAVVHGPIHYSEDIEIDVQTTSGFKETKKLEMASALDVTLTAAGEWPVAKLSAEVKASLKVTEENYREWTSETTTTTKRKFNAETTYVTWNLIDSMFLKKVVQNTYLFSNQKIVLGVDPPQILEQPYDCVLKTYEDKVADKNAALFRTAIPDLARIFHKL